MSGHRCAYFDCGKSTRDDPTIRRFSFPVNNASRCKQWILNSGNAKLATLSPQSLKKRSICSKHFKHDDLVSKKLPSTAVPIKYFITEEDSEGENIENIPKKLKVEKVTRVYPPVRKVLFDVNEPSTSKSNVFEQPDESDTSEDHGWITELVELPCESRPTLKRKLSEADLGNTKEIISLKKQLRLAKKQSNSLKLQLVETKRKLNKERLYNISFGTHPSLLPTFPKTLVQMQLKHKRRSVWLPEEKKTAISLFYKGPSTYKYLRKKGVVLPSVAIIKKWIQNFECDPGFSKKMFSNLNLKAQTMSSKERKCILVFDEMAIKKTIEYNRRLDLIEGYQDLGEFGRMAVPAKQALVLLIRGIYCKWKIPVAYFVSENGIKYNNLFSIVTTCLGKLRDIGLEPLGITCDQSKTNQKMFKRLSITVEKPYFDVNGHKYYALYDAPHLMKNLRNNLLFNNYKLNGKIITFADIRQIYALDVKSKTGRSLVKLSEKHLNPNAFEKMNVRLAVQVFSHSVAAAIKTAIKTNELSSNTAENTAEFIQTINDLFDTLNSNQLKSYKPCNCAFSLKNEVVMDAMNKGYETIKNLVKVDSKGKESRPDCFDGCLITINAIKMMAQDEMEKGYSYLLTSRLNQDALENQFSLYRQKGGYNRNPTVRSFKAAFKINIVVNLMRPPVSANAGTATSQLDEDISILEMSEGQTLEILNVEPERQSPSESVLSSTGTSSHSMTSDESTHLEDCATSYFAGYLIKKCLDQYNCEECRNILEGEEDLNQQDELLILHKNYNIINPCNLKTPTRLMKRFTKLCLKYFAKHLDKYLTQNIKKKIKIILLKKISVKLPEWFENEECSKHKEYILDLLIRTQIYKFCKFTSSTIKRGAPRKNEKLQILKNV